MTSGKDTADFIAGQMAGAGQITLKKMFGEYGVYCDGKLVALICDDQLFVKITSAGQAYLGEPAQASPYEGAKPCFLISGDEWEDGEWLSQLIAITCEALPPPKKKPKKK